MLILYYWCIIVQGFVNTKRNRTFICPYSLYLTILLQYTEEIYAIIKFFVSQYIFFQGSAFCSSAPSKVFCLISSPKSGQITRREKMRASKKKIVKIPVGLPVAPGITEIFFFSAFSQISHAIFFVTEVEKKRLQFVQIQLENG